MLRIGVTQGLDRATVRQVAAEVGVSIGAVQHYFRTKDEMLVFAFRRVVERTLARVAGVDKSREMRQVLQAVLEQLLPLDEERTAESIALVAFAARAAVAPELADVQANTLATVRRELEDLLEAARREADLPPEDASGDALRLLAFIDGLALHAVSAPGQLHPAQLVAALASALDALVPSAG